MRKPPKTLKRLLALSLTLALSSSLNAQPWNLEPEVTEPVFPGSTVASRLYFDGCADCFGPWSVTSSGRLENLDEYKYGPELTNDNDLSTCWATRGGVGSWIGFRMLRATAADRAPVDGIAIANGYTKNMERWQQNSRIRELSISVDGKEYARATLKDTPFVQRVRFPERVNIRNGELRITVLSVYPGSHFNDLCVSEVQVEGGH
ncbi:MAG TPA: hypothetical protein EYO33_12690 [Phycisphaerales bacterium]|nr:hypothetical protein [Phycisphaerales bacterium]